MPDGHAQHIGAQANHEIVGFQKLPDPGLVAAQSAHEGRVLGAEVRGVRNRLLIHRRTQKLGQGFGLVQGIAGSDLVTADDDGIGRIQHAIGEPFEAGLGGQRGGFHARRFSQRKRHLVVENVAGKGDEHRPGGRRERDLGGAANDERQVFEPRHLHGPLDQGRGHGHQGPGQQRLGETEAELLLARRDDDRRAVPGGVVERAESIAEPRRHMHVAGRQMSRCPRVAIGHGDDDGLL